MSLLQRHKPTEGPKPQLSSSSSESTKQAEAEVEGGNSPGHCGPLVQACPRAACLPK
jgi:hypothetical protein